MTTAIYDNCRTGWNSCSTNASNERGLVNVLPTDADGLGLARRPSGVDIDIVIARSEIETGVSAHCDVAAARCIVKKRTVTDGRVEEPSPVEIECTNTVSRVASASRIAKERINTVSRIIMPVMLFSSASKPIAVLPPPVVLFTSASSPRKVFALAVSQPS